MLSDDIADFLDQGILVAQLVGYLNSHRVGESLNPHLVIPFPQIFFGLFFKLIVWINLFTC